VCGQTENRRIAMLSRAKCNKIMNSTDTRSNPAIIATARDFSATRREFLVSSLTSTIIFDMRERSLTWSSLSPDIIMTEETFSVPTKRIFQASLDNRDDEMTLSQPRTCSARTGCRADDNKDIKARRKIAKCSMRKSCGSSASVYRVPS